MSLNATARTVSFRRPPAATSRKPTSVVRPPAIAIAVGLALGVLTAYAQGWLPEQLGSLANSSGSWVVIAFLLALPARNTVVAAVSAAAALLGLLAGYVLGAQLQGFPSSSALMIFWGAAAVLAGPALGASAQWVRSGRTTFAALGAGVLAGILIGEGCYGLARVADTTYPPYWVGEIVAGVVVLGAVGAWRLRRLRPVALSIATSAAIAAIFRRRLQR